MQQSATATPTQHDALPPVGRRSEDAPLPPITTGEKWFGRIRFAVGETVILALTAALAYVAQYGKDSYMGVPNVLKKFQSWFVDKLLHNKTLPLGNKGDYGARFAHIIAGTTVLMHGGNLFTPIMKLIEDRKERIVTAINKRRGKPGEVEAGQLRVQSEPKKTWGDLVKGRIVSWFFVFGSFLSADYFSKSKTTGHYRFDDFEHGFGKKIAELVHGKNIAGLAENKTYRFGKILALDIYATAAALVIWIATSKFSALMRGKKALREKPDNADPIIDAARDIATGGNERMETRTPEAPEVRRRILNDGPKSAREWAVTNVAGQTAAL